MVAAGHSKIVGHFSELNTLAMTIETDVRPIRCEDWFKDLISAKIWQAGSAAADVLIAVCMTYYVCDVPYLIDLEIRAKVSSQLKRRAPDREELGASNTVHVVVNKIIRLTIETGSLTGKPVDINLSFKH